MMEILEMALWIIATPMLLFIGLAWLGFILGFFFRSLLRDQAPTVEGDERC